MRSEVRRDLKRSSLLFQEYVWPVVSKWCGAGRIEPVEGTSTGQFNQDLDTLSGIDLWQVIHPEGVRGIASRVQGTDECDFQSYASFTVRKRRVNGNVTEWEKRRSSIFLEDGREWIYPALTCQAYIDTKGLVAAYMIRSKELYTFASNTFKGKVWTLRRVRSVNADDPSRDGNEFGAFWVDRLKGQGARVRSFERPGSAILRIP